MEPPMEHNSVMKESGTPAKSRFNRKKWMAMGVVVCLLFSAMYDTVWSNGDVMRDAWVNQSAWTLSSKVTVDGLAVDEDTVLQDGARVTISTQATVHVNEDDRLPDNLFDSTFHLRVPNDFKLSHDDLDLSVISEFVSIEAETEVDVLSQTDKEEVPDENATENNDDDEITTETETGDGDEITTETEISDDDETTSETETSDDDEITTETETSDDDETTSETETNDDDETTSETETETETETSDGSVVVDNEPMPLGAIDFNNLLVITHAYIEDGYTDYIISFSEEAKQTGYDAMSFEFVIPFLVKNENTPDRTVGDVILPDGTTVSFTYGNMARAMMLSPLIATTDVSSWADLNKELVAGGTKILNITGNITGNGNESTIWIAENANIILTASSVQTISASGPNGAIRVAPSSKLIIDGNNLTFTGSSNCFFKVYGSLTMNGGKLAGNAKGAIELYDNGTFEMNGGEITNNNGNDCSAVKVGNVNSSFTMNGGIISNNSATSVSAGAVSVNGKFFMKDGKITNNTNGAVAVWNNGSFVMEGGLIDNNTRAHGGAVYVEKGGAFKMNSGILSYNKAFTSNGGGVYVAGKFEMRGGTISNNEALNQGGGIYIDYYGDVTLYSGDIVSNKVTGATAGGSECGGGIGTGESGNMSCIIYNAVVVGNKAIGSSGHVLPNPAGNGGYGGGIWGCPFSTVTIDNGATVIAGNTAATMGDQFVIESYSNSAIATTMLGGTSYNWHWDEAADRLSQVKTPLNGNPWSAARIHGFTLSNNTTVTATNLDGLKTEFPDGTVFIYDNSATLRGGGLGGNGKIDFRLDPALPTPKPTTASLKVSKTSPDSQSNEEFVFTVSSTSGVSFALSAANVTGTGTYAVVDSTHFMLTHGAEITISGLPLGAYTVTETVPSNYKTPMVTVNQTSPSLNSNEASITFTQGVPNGTISFINSKKKGNLTVSKSFRSGNQAVTFTVTRTDGIPVDLQASGVTVNKSSNSKGSFVLLPPDRFTLTNDTEITISGLPVGTYIVTETVPDGFMIPEVTVGTVKKVVDRSEVVISDGNTSSISFVNEFDTTTTSDPSLTVMKSFVNPGGGVTSASFTVKYTGAGNLVESALGVSDAKYAGYVKDAKTMKFTLDDGGYIVISGLPDGSYAVTEDAIPDFNAPIIAVDGHSENNGVVTISAAASHVVSFINSKSSDYNPPTPTGSLKIHKKYSDPLVREEVEFTVSNVNASVDLNSFNVPVPPDVSGFEINHNTIRFMLDHDADITISGLPLGVYTVTENVPEGFRPPEIEIVKGSIPAIFSANDDEVELKFLNSQIPTGSLKVSKTFSVPSDSTPVTFTITRDSGDVDLQGIGLSVLESGSGVYNLLSANEFTLTHGKEITISGLPLDKYTVIETVPYSFNAPAVSGGSPVTNGASVTLASGDIAAISFVNSKTPVTSGTSGSSDDNTGSTSRDRDRNRDSNRNRDSGTNTPLTTGNTNQAEEVTQDEGVTTAETPEQTAVETTEQTTEQSDVQTGGNEITAEGETVEGAADEMMQSFNESFEDNMPTIYNVPSLSEIAPERIIYPEQLPEGYSAVEYADNIYIIYDDEQVPLGYVIIPDGMTLDDIFILDEMIPFGSLNLPDGALKANPKTGGSSYVSLCLLVLVSLSLCLMILLRKRSLKRIYHHIRRNH